jgi:hypothetical protein
LDLEALEYFLSNKNWFINYKLSNSSKFITIANRRANIIVRKDNIPIIINNQEIIIQRVNYIPNLKAILTSTKSVVKKG